MINRTEKRSVLHVALRYPKDKKLMLNEVNVVEKVHSVLERVKSFSDAVREGKFPGHTKKPLTDVVVIGIGGSYLSIEFVYEGLRFHPQGEKNSNGRRLRFLANVDPIDVKKALQNLDCETTLFIVNSKTFTTAETMLNARTCR